MTVQIQQTGTPKIISTVLGTALGILYAPGSQNIRGLLESIAVCNVSAGAVTFSLVYTDGADYRIYDQLSIASHATVILKDHPIVITTGTSLKAQASAVTALHLTAVVVEQTATRAA